MKSIQKGFTLIDLMIVVAIIGILAAVAIPAYQDYTKRAHVAEGLNLASAAKVAVTEYYSSQGAWPADNTAAGLATATAIAGNAVKSVTVLAGVITVVYNAKVENDKVIVLKPLDANGSITWTCNTLAGSTVDVKYRPSNCRG